MASPVARRGRRVGLWGVVVGLGLGLAPAAAADAPWVEVESPNFSVYSDAGAKTARRIALQFEQVRLAFGGLWPGARTTSPRPVVILAVKDDSGLKTLLPEYFERKGGKRPAGITVPSADKYFIALNAAAAELDISGYNPYHLIYHEYIHVLLDLNLRRTPAWLGEGLAEFFGATLVQGDRLVVGKPLPWHIDTLRETQMFDLERLVTVGHSSPEYNEDSKSGIFYAQSWALVHMLATDPTNAGSRRLNALVAALQAGQDDLSAARAALGDLPALDKELRSYVRRYAFRYGHIDADARLDGRGFPARDVGAAELLALQGDFHARRGRSAVARALLDQALQLDPRQALAHAARGYLAWTEQGLDAALEHYERAVEADPRQWFAQALLGEALTRQDAPGAMERAEAALVRAIELNHDYAPAHEHLAQVIVTRGGDIELALRLARRAAALAPDDTGARLNVAWILWRAGRRDEAFKEAQAALSSARDDAGRAQAQTWLDRFAERTMAEGAVPPAQAPRASALDTPQAPPPDEQRRGCEAAQLADCAALADRYRVGDGVETDPARALALYLKACDGAFVSACTTLGWAYLGGDLVARDPVAAARAFGRACDGGVIEGCAQAGFVLAFLDDAPHDEKAALPRLFQACDGGDVRSCSGLGVLYMSGKGVPRNPTRAAGWFERGCSGDDMNGCVNLAVLLEAGQGVAKDPARARELYARACAKGVERACARTHSGAVPEAN